MNPIFVILTVLVLTVGVAPVPAQTAEKPPMPQAPYLAPVPDYGHWVVAFKYESASAAPAADGDGDAATPAPKPPAAPDGFPVTLDTIKTGELKGIVLTFADGTSKQFTCQGDWVLTSSPKGPQLSVASSSQRPFVYYSPGFVMLDGVTINLSNFKGYLMYKGTPAFHYQVGELEVWIDINSMLPLAVKNGGVEAAFQFLAPPPKPFVIPQEQADLLKKEQDADKKARALR
jgi:hypothetical protein